MNTTRHPHHRPWLRNHLHAICLSTLLFLFGLWASATAGAAEATVIGFVEEIRGSSQSYALRRGDAELRLQICDQVQTNDRIVVRRDDGKVQLRLTTGELLTITQAQSDQPLKAEGAPTNFRSNLLTNLAGLLTPWHDFVELNFSVRGGTEPPPAGKSLDLPLLPARGAAIAAGHRSFALAWLGGTPPFSISLVGSADGQTVLAVEGMTERKLPPRPLALSVGTYTLRLLDGAGQRIERPLDAVPDGELPRAPSEPALAGLPRTWRATAQAGWLAQRDSGRWLLEAFLESAPIANDFEPARTLADLLAQGGPVTSR